MDRRPNMSRNGGSRVAPLPRTRPFAACDDHRQASVLHCGEAGYHAKRRASIARGANVMDGRCHFVWSRSYESKNKSGAPSKTFAGACSPARTPFVRHLVLFRSCSSTRMPLHAFSSSMLGSAEISGCPPAWSSTTYCTLLPPSIGA